MKMIRMGLFLAALLFLGAAADTIAQGWPSKPVKLIGVFPAGGSVDQVARILAQQLSEHTGQSDNNIKSGD